MSVYIYKYICIDLLVYVWLFPQIWGPFSVRVLAINYLSRSILRPLIVGNSHICIWQHAVTLTQVHLWSDEAAAARGLCLGPQH